jgi:uncharacterized RDD family membrane protein YckC
MKCPKCHYLSFEPSPRCRNCGFDLGIAEADLPIRPAEEAAAGAPPEDLALRPKRRTRTRNAPKTLGLIHPARDVEPEVAETTASVDVDLVDLIVQAERLPSRPVAAATAVASMPDAPMRMAPEPGVVLELPRREAPRPMAAPVVVASAGASSAVATAAAPTPGELPLFVKGLLSRPAAPPLAVRRAPPEPIRPKPAPTPPRKPGPFDLDLMEDLRRVEAEEGLRIRAAAKAEAASTEAVTVSRGARFAALAADWGLLTAIAALVFLGALRVSGARPGDLGMQALVPMVAFLVLITFAYFVLFTIGNGQTPGKMVLHIRVVDALDVGRPPSVRQAFVRTLLAAASGALFGVGFLPALGERGVAAPDRFTQTRTVRA